MALWLTRRKQRRWFISFSGAGQPEVNKELVTSRSNLLRKFLVSEDKELQAVYALQRLFVDLEQPPSKFGQKSWQFLFCFGGDFDNFGI